MVPVNVFLDWAVATMRCRVDMTNNTSGAITVCIVENCFFRPDARSTKEPVSTQYRRNRYLQRVAWLTCVAKYHLRPKLQSHSSAPAVEPLTEQPISNNAPTFLP